MTKCSPTTSPEPLAACAVGRLGGGLRESDVTEQSVGRAGPFRPRKELSRAGIVAQMELHLRDEGEDERIVRLSRVPSLGDLSRLFDAPRLDRLEAAAHL